MSYTNGLDKPTDYFNTKLYTGNGTNPTSITGVGFQPDWLWIKRRDASGGHNLYDVVRGSTKRLESHNDGAEATTSDISSFDSDGFTLNTTGVNTSSATYVSWNWLAGGTAPAITYSVKVVSDSGNKYRFDDFGTSAVTLDLQEGGTYTFDQSDSSNSGHPLRFSTTSDGTHGGGSEYTTNVTTTGTPGSAGAKTVITVASSAPTLYYYCSVHSGMGGQANTNSTFGSSNFGGSIQANVSANTTSGFSIVSYTGTGSNATVGHGLGVAPSVIIIKHREKGSGYNWVVYAEAIGYSMSNPDPETDFLKLNLTDARVDDNTMFNDTAPTSSVFSIGTAGLTNNNTFDFIAYCFAEKKGYSKFGSYTGNGNADGPFIYTGFKPAWVMAKRTDTANVWVILDNKRDPFNGSTESSLRANASDAENTSYKEIEFVSNGMKVRSSGTGTNASGGTYIYMAFAENPFVTSTGIPTTAR